MIAFEDNFQPSFRTAFRSPGTVRSGGAAALDPAIVSYQTATGISSVSAGKLNTLLETIRLSGVEPLHLWVGGSDYNQPNQQKSIIGSDATLVGASAASPYVEDVSRCRFNRSKYFRFDMPPSLISADLQDYTLLVWYEQATVDGVNDSAIWNAYVSTTARGFSLQVSPNYGQTMIIASSATTNQATQQAIESSNAVRAGDRVIGLLRRAGAQYNINDIEVEARGIAANYNGNNIFYLGGNNLAATQAIAPHTLANIKVHAVLLAAGGTASNEAYLRLIDAPYIAGTRPTQNVPMVLPLGDSITSTGWPKDFCTSASLVNPHGGAWADQCSLENLAVGGQSLVFMVGLTDTIKRYLRMSRNTPKIFVYTVEAYFSVDAAALGIANVTEWYDYTESWLQDIAATTGATMVLGSYHRGNVALGESYMESDRDRVLLMANDNGWGYLPLWENPHSRIGQGGTDPNGYYADAIHHSANGRLQQAELVASVLVHPYDTATPRADIANPPVVTGTLGVGNVLSCTTGSWFNSPTSYTYQWLRALAPISGATASTYTQVSADQTKYLSCRVTATKSGVTRKASFTSAPVGVVP